jgi:DNA-binding transcriptional MerR regulator
MMKMKPRSFRIGQLADYLSLEQSVIRFWEKEFGITASRSPGGQRFYKDNDIKKFELIKSLLYTQGFTIAGARKHLQELKNSKSSKKESFSFNASKITPLPEVPVDSLPNQKTTTSKIEDNLALEEQIRELQKKLLKLRELL